MHFDWIYLVVFLFFLFIIGVFGGISYITMRFCNRWTKDHRYETLLDSLIFIGAFFLISFVSFFIFITTFTFQR
ncbi:heme/copper-type cytochrome/quinol oxidase subunit 2 [Chryseobacterium jejuense]|nr:heme/copper-type cytochrome/quinol oxidase subunit 2 [Chryseobacterium jejuense]